MDKSAFRLLHLAEPLNAEVRPAKLKGAQEVAAHCAIRIYAHDCSCRLAGEFGSTSLCQLAWLDSFHASRHKCSSEKYNPSDEANVDLYRALNINSQICEQGWRQFNLLVPVLKNLSPGRFRAYLRHYCIWRNAYERSVGQLKQRPLVNQAVARNGYAERRIAELRRGRAIISSSQVKQPSMKT